MEPAPRIQNFLCVGVEVAGAQVEIETLEQGPRLQQREQRFDGERAQKPDTARPLRARPRRSRSPTGGERTPCSRSMTARATGSVGRAWNRVRSSATARAGSPSAK